MKGLPRESYCPYCGVVRSSDKDVDSCWSCGGCLRRNTGFNKSGVVLVIFPVLFLILGIVSAKYAFQAVVYTVGLYSEHVAVKTAVCELCSPECGGTCLHAGGECGCLWVDYSGDYDAAFALSLEAMYGIVLRDEDEFLSNPDNLSSREAIESTLAAFSPAYIVRLTSFFKSLDAKFVLQIQEGEYTVTDSSDVEYVLGQFDISDDSSDAVITLYYYPDLGVHGINVATLAHELGHAIHYNMRYFAGDALIEKYIGQHNAGFEYVGDRHIEEWDYVVHASVFAYSYGMMNCGEDVATIFERLVDSPDSMRVRLSDPSNLPLFYKAVEVRNLTYTYVSSEPCAVFAPVYYAEEYLGS